MFNECPKYWRFVVSTSDIAADQEELVLSIQGVIVQKDLPPVIKR